MDTIPNGVYFHESSYPFVRGDIRSRAYRYDAATTLEHMRRDELIKYKNWAANATLYYLSHGDGETAAILLEAIVTLETRVNFLVNKPKVEYLPPSVAEDLMFYTFDEVNEDIAYKDLRFNKNHLRILFEELGLKHEYYDERFRYRMRGDRAFMLLLYKMSGSHKDLPQRFAASVGKVSSISKLVEEFICNSFGHLLFGICPGWDFDDYVDNEAHKYPLCQTSGQICRWFLWVKSFVKVIEDKMKSQDPDFIPYPPDKNVFAFVDGVDFDISRPADPQIQNLYYSGHKKKHCIIHQGVVLPNGIIASFHGSFAGSRNDSGIWAKIDISQELQRLNTLLETMTGITFPDNQQYKFLGDSIYPIERYLARIFRCRSTPNQLTRGRCSRFASTQPQLVILAC